MDHRDHSQTSGSMQEGAVRPTFGRGRGGLGVGGSSDNIQSSRDKAGLGDSGGWSP